MERGARASPGQRHASDRTRSDLAVGRTIRGRAPGAGACPAAFPGERGSSAGVSIGTHVHRASRGPIRRIRDRLRGESHRHDLVRPDPVAQRSNRDQPERVRPHGGVGRLRHPGRGVRRPAGAAVARGRRVGARRRRRGLRYQSLRSRRDPEILSESRDAWSPPRASVRAVHARGPLRDGPVDAKRRAHR